MSETVFTLPNPHADKAPQLCDPNCSPVDVEALMHACEEIEVTHVLTKEVRKALRKQAIRRFFESETWLYIVLITIILALSVVEVMLGGGHSGDHGMIYTGKHFFFY